MYVFSDPKVIDMIQKIVNTYSRIGEHLNIMAKPECLELSVTNSSYSVSGKVELVPPLFSGIGALKNACVKARALDLILKRVDIESSTALKWEFMVTNTGQEQVMLSVVNINGVTKQFRLPCLHTVALPVELESVGTDPFTFACLPSLLREAFAACESSADELRMSFKSGGVYLQAQKKGKLKPDLAAPLRQGGLKTIISLPPDAFNQITALVPRHLELKFKEFRTMLNFLDHVGEGHLITAEFRNCTNTTPVIFTGRFSAFPTVQLEFKFVARSLLIPNNQPNTWLRIGAPVNSGSRTRSYSTSNNTDDGLEDEYVNVNVHTNINSYNNPTAFESGKRIRISNSSHALHISTNQGTHRLFRDSQVESPPPANSPEQEIGYTQAPSNVQGLFD